MGSATRACAPPAYGPLVGSARLPPEPAHRHMHRCAPAATRAPPTGCPPTAPLGYLRASASGGAAPLGKVAALAAPHKRRLARSVAICHSETKLDDHILVRRLGRWGTVSSSSFGDALTVSYTTRRESESQCASGAGMYSISSIHEAATRSRRPDSAHLCGGGACSRGPTPSTRSSRACGGATLG